MDYISQSMVNVYNDNYIPGIKEFLHMLREKSPDLEELIKSIELYNKKYQGYFDFENNPFEIVKGNRRFSIKERRNINPSPNYPNSEHYEYQDSNALDLFQTKEELFELLDSNFIIEDSKIELNITRRINLPNIFYLTENQIITPKYLGPKIKILPDTQLELNGYSKEFMNRLGNHPAIHKDITTIQLFELKKGGLHKLFPNGIPDEVLRGQKTIEKRLGSLTSFRREELNLFYNIITDYFATESREIFDLADKNPKENEKTLADKFVRIKSSEIKCPLPNNYNNLVSKVIEKHRIGNDYNLMPDKILAATCFTYNLLEHSNKAVIISNDHDIISIMGILFDQIIPKYLAVEVINAINQRNPYYVQLPGYERRTINSARNHLHWALENSANFKISAGIVYVPSQNLLYIQEIPKAFKYYFNRIKEYRSGKIELISKMALTGLSAQKAFERLENE